MSNDSKILELIRVIDATLGDVNPNGLVTGHNCLSIIKFISSFEGFDKFVTPEFKSVIQEEVKRSSDKQNVREHAKKILTYPRVGYAPWDNFEVEENIITEIQKEGQNVKFQFDIIEGKVYAKCTTSTNLVEIAYNKLKNKLPEFLRRNFETCHITIINSNVVADIGISNVQQFVQKYDKTFNVRTGKIKSTVSEDWSRFAECYVIEIECQEIDDFLREFNKEFNKSIKITKHITFAIRPRSIWC